MTETGLSLGKERLERFFWENNHKDATVADDERLRAQAALAIFKKKVRRKRCTRRHTQLLSLFLETLFGVAKLEFSKNERDLASKREWELLREESGRVALIWARLGLAEDALAFLAVEVVEAPLNVARQLEVLTPATSSSLSERKTARSLEKTRVLDEQLHVLSRKRELRSERYVYLSPPAEGYTYRRIRIDAVAALVLAHGHEPRLRPHKRFSSPCGEKDTRFKGVTWYRRMSAAMSTG